MGDKTLSGDWVVRAREYLREQTHTDDNREALRVLLESEAGDWKIVEMLAQFAAQAYTEGRMDVRLGR